MEVEMEVHDIAKNSAENGNIQNKRTQKYWKHKNILLYLLLGFAIGYFTKNQTTNANTFDISYISQDELIQLEHERIRNQDLTDQQLFFGKLDEVIKLIEQIANEKAGSNNRVVFSQGIVSGNKVKSISHEVHKELVSRYLYQDTYIKIK